MEEVNKNTELENTDKKLHISDVKSSRGFSFYTESEFKAIMRMRKIEKLLK